MSGIKSNIAGGNVDYPIAPLGTVYKVAIGASSAQSSAITGRAVLLTPTVACHIAVGANPTASRDSTPRGAWSDADVLIESGQKIAAINAVDGESGFLFITVWNGL